MRNTSEETVTQAVPESMAQCANQRLLTVTAGPVRFQ
jgi:hypothetical protein